MSVEHPTDTVEDYLQAIYSLEGEGETVISARLARRMRVTPPTAWATVRRMERDGLVKLDGKKVIHFTPKGRELAEDITRRHRLSERFLVDVMGLGWAEAHEEAHQFEHAITPRLEQQIMKMAGNPKTCPHGSPIPGTGATLDPNLERLGDLKAGDEATLIHISEELEEDHELLVYLERSRMIPGADLKVVDATPSTGVIVVKRDGNEVPLGLEVAGRIRVRRTGAVKAEAAAG